ncbi:hypothetical protein FE782_16780 [Paenibacillus antri]|uniref:SLH domain-containing protein n=1 Tax=Paenibacillus antri TaxID=2582848 RepID=A0A5R9GHT0_9BACL|nr:chitobiase/beta-hexosaminidase C-terminal domain-containing protein [Paenibacillus antri]TLS51045.1 hypothetical protein FE782_16780 [Paenibacillus antri]
MARKQSTFYKLGFALALAVAAICSGMYLTYAGADDWTDYADTDWYLGDPSYAEYPSYTITTAAELAGVAKLVNEGYANGFAGKTLGIAGDIDLSAHDWIPIGTPGTPFKGAIIPKTVGGSVNISGMNVSNEATFAGFIGFMEGGTAGGIHFTSTGSIQAASVAQAVYAGAAVAYMNGISTVYDITSSIPTTVTTGGHPAYVGGIVGKGEGSISNSNNFGAISASATSGGVVHVGGIAGYSESPRGLQIKKVANNGAVSASGDAASLAYAGGIAGYVFGSIAMDGDATPISNSGAVTVSAARINYAGGAIGYVNGDLTLSTNTTNAGPVAIEAPMAEGSYAGGLIGAIAKEHRLAAGFANAAAVTNNGGVNVYTGGLVGYIETPFVWDGSYTNGTAITATGSREVHTGGLIGGAAASVTFAGEAKNTGPIAVSGGMHAGKPEEAYTGGLIGSSSDRVFLDNESPSAYGNEGTVTVTGGVGLYTGGVAGNVAYARTNGTPSNNVYSAGALNVTGIGKAYTGGFIGALAPDAIDKTIDGASFASAITVAATGATAETPASVGGIVGYAANAAVNDASFSGTLTSTGGGAHSYAGGIAGTSVGGTIARSAVGNTADTFASLSADGTVGGVVGRLMGDGVVDTANVAYASLTSRTVDGFAGGVAGKAQGAIRGAAVGVAGVVGSEEDESVTLAAGGVDRFTAGGIVGANEGVFALTASAVTNIQLANAADRTGYALGGLAGALTADASIGEVGVPITVRDIVLRARAAQAVAGGAIGTNASSGVYVAVTNGAFYAESAGAKVGGLAGAQTAAVGTVAGATPDVTVSDSAFQATAEGVMVGGLYGEVSGSTQRGLASDSTIAATGANAKIGGVAGRNVGALRDSEARNVVLSASGAGSELGGAVGRSEANGGARASITDVASNASFDPILTALAGAANAKVGGIVGFASATDIVRPVVTTVTSSDYAMIGVQSPQTAAGGIAGRAENSAIEGGGETNVLHLFLSSTPAANAVEAGGVVGHNRETKIARITSSKSNVILNGTNAIAGGIAGYNLSSGEAFLVNNYAADLYVKANASATPATIGGMIGLNDKQASDPILAPATAVSTLQNNRIVGRVEALSPAAVTGGMVGENRSLIANNSIPDKISVISKGGNGTVGGLAGVNAASGTLYYTYSNANLTIEGTGTLGGGLVGANQGKVLASYVDIDVVGRAVGANGNAVFLGGLVGRNTGAIDKSYSNSKVTAQGAFTNVGGLVGDQASGTISNSYAGGAVAAAGERSYVGGFLGRIANGFVSTAYSAGQATASHATSFAGGFAGRYDNASKELLSKAFYLKDEAKFINKDLPDFAEGDHRWLNVHARLATILDEALQDRTFFPGLSGWDFENTWRYGSLNAVYKYPELIRTANSGGGVGNDVNANINWYMRDPGSIFFEIKTEAELAGLAAIVNGTFPGVEKFDFEGRTIRVANPIHIQSNQWIAIGNAEANAFEGTFEGNGHLIDGLTVVPGQAFSGLFGVIGEEGLVKDIVLEPLSVVGEQATGAVAALNKGEVANVEVKLLNEAKVAGGTVGGLIGVNAKTMKNLTLRMAEGTRIEASRDGAIVGGAIGDNSGALEPGQFALISSGGSVGSSYADATVGGVIGKQSGDLRDFAIEIVPTYAISATGANNVVGGYVGRYVSGVVERGTVVFEGGTLQTTGAGSTLGAFAGESLAGNVLRDVTVSSSVAGPHLIGNGTIGGLIGAKTGQGVDAYDLERVGVAGVRFAAQPNGAQATVGGIAGTMTSVALQDATFRATIDVAAERVVAGGIVGEALDSILFRTDASTDIAATTKTGVSSVGGIAGIVRATNRDARFDFGRILPFYPGLYEAKAHTTGIRATGVDHGGDLYVGGAIGRLENASMYHVEASSALTVEGAKIAAVGGLAGYADGIVVRSTATTPVDASDSRVYRVGGVAGQAAGGEMHYAHTIGSPIVVGAAVTKPGLTPAAHVGGFVGRADHTAFMDSYAKRDIALADNNQDNTIYVGGFAGMMGDATGASGAVRRAYATGELNVSGITGSIVGGFAGSVDRYDIEDAYATGSVSNTGYDTRSGGFAGEIERGATIRRAFAAPAQVVTKGVNHATRSYAGGFVGFNDGAIIESFANVQALTTTVSGANAYRGGFVGYNFRDGNVTLSSYLVADAGAAGHNLGTAQATAGDASGAYAAFAGWNLEPDSSIFSLYDESELVVRTGQQMAAAVKLHNADTGLAYYRLFDRTAAARPGIAAVTLGADIDMTGIAWIPFDAWTGTFDGQGYKVTGIRSVAAPAAANGFIAENRGTISNVELQGSFAGGANVGAAVGVNRYGAVVSGVSANASIGGAGNVGGIAGANEGRIEKSFARGGVGGNDAAAAIAAGGIAGANESGGEIAESFSFADVAVVANEASAGGVAGVNRGDIRYAYATGAVQASGTAKAWAGGIAGRASDGGIRQAYGAGTVVAGANGKLATGVTSFGGIAGEKNAGAVIADAAFNRQMLKNDTAYFLTDGSRVRGGGAAGARGLLARELASATLPQGFDGAFWQAAQGSYPQLKTFGGTAASKVSAAAIVFADKDAAHAVRGEFELGGGASVAWTADAGTANIRNASGKRIGTLLTTGIARLTAAMNGETRVAALNAPVLKYDAVAAAPTVESGEKTFATQATVTLRTTEPTGIIYYTLDGSTPDEHSTPYAAPIVLTETKTLKAIAVADGKEDSAVLSQTFAKQVAGGGGFGGGGFIPPTPKEPTVGASIGSTTVPAGEPAAVPKNSKLTLTAPPGQIIYYTTDGSTPTMNSPRYAGELIITGKMTIKVITDKSDEVVTYHYDPVPAKYELKADVENVKYIGGYATGEFKPDQAISRYELVNVLAPLLDMEDVSVGSLFDDVHQGDEALVAFFASAGIIEGYPNGTFGGERGMTRAEFIVVLSRLLKLTIDEAGETKLSDIRGHWSEKYVNAFTKAGYVKGFPDGTFKPEASISRAEAVVLINRIAGIRAKGEGATTSYGDLPPNHWAYADIMAASK